MSARTLWHYAPAQYIPAIEQTGALTCSNAGAPGEAPLLWFSANQIWEPTASKIDGRNHSWLTHKQMQDRGIVRFGVEATDPRLLTWKVACSYAGTPRELRRGMERVGIKKGANPDHWFASPVPISIDELHLQFWRAGWHDVIEL